VRALPILNPNPVDKNTIVRNVAEKAAIILTQNDDGSVFRVTGCSGFGHHESSYRICAENGQIENLRDHSDRVLLSYNSWQKPEGCEASKIYKPDFTDKDDALIAKAGHGGGDFFVAREFLDCIREGRQPEFDVYFATAMASAAILGHRSLLEDGKPARAGAVADADGYVCYFNSTEKAVRGCVYEIGEGMTNGLIPAGTYFADPQGRLMDGRGELLRADTAMNDGFKYFADGDVRYYVDGKPVRAGLVADGEGSLYYFNGTLKAVRGARYSFGESMANGLLPAGTYSFDENGKLILP
jgi:hypothetical protein